MKRFVIYLATGEIIGHTSAEEAPNVPETTGHLYLESATGEPDTHWVDGGALVEYSAGGMEKHRNRPSGKFQWNPSTEQWIDLRAIEVIRADLIQKLKHERDTRLEGGFTWDGSRFDSDTAVSQPRLLGLFTTAIAGGIPPEGYPWRLADNTWRVLSAADAIGVWGAFQYHMASLFSAFAAHEAAVKSEVNEGNLRSYDTTIGWPV